MVDHVFKLLDIIYHNPDKSFSDLADMYENKEFGDGEFRDAIASCIEHHYVRETFPDSVLVFEITNRGRAEYDRESEHRKGATSV